MSAGTSGLEPTIPGFGCGALGLAAGCQRSRVARAVDENQGGADELFESASSQGEQALACDLSALCRGPGTPGAFLFTCDH
jgi:hypothetical protein